MARVYTSKLSHIDDIDETLSRRFDNKYYTKKISDTRRTPWRIQIMYDAQQVDIAKSALEAFENGEKITQRELAAKYQIHPDRLRRSLKEIRANWRESAIRDWDALINHELAVLDALETEAWEAWHESKKDAETYTEEHSEDGVKQKTTLKGQTGDVKYLHEINRCIEQRVKLLGLEPNKTIEIKTYQDRIVEYLRDGRISYDVLKQSLDEKTAKEYARKAGLLNSGRI